MITTACVVIVGGLLLAYTVVFSRITTRLHQSEAKGGGVHIVSRPENEGEKKLHRWLKEALADKVKDMPAKLYAEALMRAGVTSKAQLFSLTEAQLDDIGFFPRHAAMFSEAFEQLRDQEDSDSPPGRGPLDIGHHLGSGTHIAVRLKERVWFLNQKVRFNVTVRTPPGEKLLAIANLRISVHGPDGLMKTSRVVGDPEQSGEEVVQHLRVSYRASSIGTYFLFIRVANASDIHFTPESWVTRMQKVFNRSRVSDEHVHAVEKLLREIRRLQYPPDCNKARLYFYPLESEMDYGVGANAEYMVSSFGRALATNRTFVIPTKTHEGTHTSFYWAEKLCPSQSWFCYFAATSTCTEEHFDRRTMIDDDDSPRSKRARVVHGNPCPRFEAKKAFAKLANKFCPYKLLKGTTRSGHAMNLCSDGLQHTQSCLVSQTWVAAFLAEWVFRPLPWLLDKFEASRRAMDARWKHPLVTMHIRKTDKLKGKLKEARDPLRVYALDRYFSALDHISKTWHDDSKRAFVATDSDIVIRAMQKRWAHGRDLIFNDTQKRYAKGTILLLRECRDKYGHRSDDCVNQNEEGINALRDIWLLSSGDGFVGTRSSFFGRVAFLIMYASGRMRNYKFLDHDPWSHDFTGKFGFPQTLTLCF